MPGNDHREGVKIFHRDWPDDVVDRYIGHFSQSYFAYAASESIRKDAASGGVITALNGYLLEAGIIDGALVCRPHIVNGELTPEFFIAENIEMLLSAQGSTYCAVEFMRDAVPKIKDFKGKLAVVGLPCDIRKLQQLRKREQDFDDQIALTISLFCGHNSRPELTHMILKKLDRKGVGVAAFRYRHGHWRGELEATLSTGEKISKPFSYFSDYQNLFYFCQQKCHYCHDHTGYHADISVGDIWSQNMKNHPIKHSAVILRTGTGESVFRQSVEASWLVAKKEPINAICDGQARSMPFHYNVSARARAGKLLGIQIKDDVGERVRWNDLLTGLIVLTNEKLSRTEFGKKLIARIPRFMLKLMLYFLKGLESI